MKKNSRLIALLLALTFLICAAACSAGGEETTESETASTSAPETTESITAETTEDPYVSVVAPPDTSPETTSEFPPHDGETLHVLIQEGKCEALTTAFADEENRALISEREEKLLSDHNTVIRISKSADIVERIKNGVLTSNNPFDLLLLNSNAGAELLTYGALESLSEVGIGITPESAGIHKSITESLTVGGSVYLLACDALVSDLTSVSVIEYNGTSLSSDPAAKAIEGNFTVELLLAYISELKTDSFAIEQSSALALFTAVGGEVFVKNDKGLPLSALSEDKNFTKKYSLASELVRNDSQTNREAVFTVTRMASVKENNIFLPLPKADAGSEYITLADAGSISLFAAPVGVVDGGRLAKLLNCLNVSSGNYRDSVRSELAAKNGAEGEKMLSLIEKSTRLDLGILLGWGDIDSYISDGITSGTSAEDLLSDRIASMRNNAVKTAAEIVAERLDIE